jgi:hypothetical protein
MSRERTGIDCLTSASLLTPAGKLALACFAAAKTPWKFFMGRDDPRSSPMRTVL